MAFTSESASRMEGVRQPRDASRRTRSRSPLGGSGSRRRFLPMRGSTPRRESARRPSPPRSSEVRRTRSVSRRSLRRSPYRRSSPASVDATWRGSSSASSSGEAFRMDKISERREEVERVNAKREKKNKDKEFKFTKTSCETQYKFNSKIKEICAEKMRVELKKHFREGLPTKIEELIKEGEKEIDDENHKLKIENEFGSKAVVEFSKEDLARNDKEEKKIKRLRKDKKEREEKARSSGFARGGRGGYRGYRSAPRNYGTFARFDGRFDGRFDRGSDREKAGKEESKTKAGAGVKCYNCQGFGHMARDCTKPQADSKAKGK